ncbi:MAG: hypothetical protein IJ733_13030 [Lachnospiraceae bacterium]|nr:hypothetical protein [Lachnospiraceae bacterium]
MKKIFFLFVFLIALVFSGCGEKTSDQNVETEKSEQKERETEASVNQTQQSVVITSIQKNTETGSACVEAEISVPDEKEVSYYSIDGFQICRTDVEKSDLGCLVKWYGFYEKESSLENPVVDYRFQKVEDVKREAAAGDIEMRKFQAGTDDMKFSVFLTSFSVVIKPEGDWTEEEKHYDFFAQDKEKKQYYMCTLFSKGTTRKYQKEVVLNPENMEELGNGYSVGKELDDFGISYVMNEEIDLERVEEIIVR